MELLATVDWLIERDHCEPTLAGIRAGLRRWPAGPASAERKLRLFDDRLIGLGPQAVSDHGGKPSSIVEYMNRRL